MTVGLDELNHEMEVVDGRQGERCYLPGLEEVVEIGCRIISTGRAGAPLFRGAKRRAFSPFVMWKEPWPVSAMPWRAARVG